MPSEISTSSPTLWKNFFSRRSQQKNSIAYCTNHRCVVQPHDFQSHGHVYHVLSPQAGHEVRNTSHSVRARGPSAQDPPSRPLFASSYLNPPPCRRATTLTRNVNNGREGFVLAVRVIFWFSLAALGTIQDERRRALCGGGGAARQPRVKGNILSSGRPREELRTTRRTASASCRRRCWRLRRAATPKRKRVLVTVTCREKVWRGTPSLAYPGSADPPIRALALLITSWLRALPRLTG
jgi:hypothetical protein